MGFKEHFETNGSGQSTTLSIEEVNPHPFIKGVWVAKEVLGKGFFIQKNPFRVEPAPAPTPAQAEGRPYV